MDGIPKEQIGRFRRRLVETLAFELPVSRVLPDVVPSELASALGVREEIVVEAAALRRRGFRLPPSQEEWRQATRRGHVMLRVKLWAALTPKVRAAAKRRKEDPATFVRSMLHAVLRTTAEPVATHPERELHKGSRWRVQSTVSAGMFQALCRRAAAVGVARTRYVNLWLSDYFSGRLPPVRIKTVQLGECFDDAALYVLPHFEEPVNGPPHP